MGISLTLSGFCFDSNQRGNIRRLGIVHRLLFGIETPPPPRPCPAPLVPIFRQTETPDDSIGFSSFFRVCDWTRERAPLKTRRNNIRVFFLIAVLHSFLCLISQLYLLQGAVEQQEWRVPALHHALLNQLKPYLNHSYKLVRDRIGR